jgi:hypothetical protein
MCFQELEHFAIGQNFASLIVISIAFIPQHGFIARFSRQPAQHSGGAGVNKSSYSSLVTCFQEVGSPDNIRSIQLLPMLAAFVIVSKISGRMENGIDAG